MEFKLRLKKHGKCFEKIIDVDCTSIGLEGVDRIRNETGLNLDLDIIKGFISGMEHYSIDIKVDESEARKIEEFKKNNVVIFYLENNLNNFVDNELFVEQSSENGTVYKAGLKPVINNQKIIDYILDNIEYIRDYNQKINSPEEV